MESSLILFGSLFLLLLLGVPIAVSLGVVALFAFWKYDLGIIVCSANFYSGIAKYPLLAVPFFILAGMILEKSGVSKRLVNLASLIVGSIPGGIAIVAILVSVFFGGISGSGPADAAAIGAVLIPEMARKNYPKGFAAAVIASAGSTAIIVPPSIALILYGVITTTSIPALFAAGAIPGALAGLSLIVPTYFISRRKGYIGHEKGTIQDVIIAFKDAFWGLIAPLVILGGIYGGVFTATEAAVVAVFYGLFVGFVVYKTLTLRDLYNTLVEASLSSAVVLLIVTLAGLFSWAGATMGVMDKLAKEILTLSNSSFIALLLVNCLILCAGMFLDAISIYYVFLPILIPIISHFGWDPLWFGIIMTLNLAIGQFTPPVAVNLYVTTNLARIPLEDTAREVMPFIIAMSLVLLLLLIFPQLALFLPRVLKLYG